MAPFITRLDHLSELSGGGGGGSGGRSRQLVRSDVAETYNGTTGLGALKY